MTLPAESTMFFERKTKTYHMVGIQYFLTRPDADLKLDEIVKPFESTSPFHQNKTNLNVLRALLLAREHPGLRMPSHVRIRVTIVLQARPGSNGLQYPLLDVLSVPNSVRHPVPGPFLHDYQQQSWHPLRVLSFLLNPNKNMPRWVIR